MGKCDKSKYPKILVISNNPFSQTSNNGKTLASFFKEFPPEKVSQLYFSSELPSEGFYQNYYRISDKQIFRSLYSFNKAGSVVAPQINSEISEYKAPVVKHSTTFIVKSNFFRLLRELMWKCTKWKSDHLVTWLTDFSPDIVFFCAGDAGFAYDIVSFVLDKTNAKLATYITDDYILPRRTSSLLWWIRRNFIFRKMNKAISNSSLFITISEEMRSVYKDIFGKNSIIALNMAESMKTVPDEPNKLKSGPISLIYTGGLHFKRYNTLSLLAEAIRKYNNLSGSTKVFLSIYSIQEPSKRVLKRLNIQGASSFFGGLNSEELKIKLNEADILVHVESFDQKSIESTKLSISTKIPEYLSMGKPILAIGPNEVASMKFISDVAFCINSKNEIYSELCTFLDNERVRKDLSVKSAIIYDDKYGRVSLNRLTQSLIDIIAKV